MQADLMQYLKEIDDSDYGKNHRQRFIESYNFIAPILMAKLDKKYLDLASYGHFQKLLKKLFPMVDVECSEYFDLRYKFPIPDNTYDVIFFMEALEHLKDRDSEHPKDSQLYLDDISGYSQNGVKNCMKEIYRILKPGGILFMTTPNINSWTAVNRTLMLYSPTFYIPHVKEFSVQEIYELHRDASLRVVKIETPENCHGLQSVQANRPRLQKLIDACVGAGYSPELRGDCIFTLGMKHQ